MFALWNSLGSFFNQFDVVIEPNKILRTCNNNSPTLQVISDYILSNNYLIILRDDWKTWNSFTVLNCFLITLDTFYKFSNIVTLNDSQISKIDQKTNNHESRVETKTSMFQDRCFSNLILMWKNYFLKT